MKLSILRKVTLTLAFVLIAIGLILNTGAGTLSSFGWQALATICPLGALESMIASKTIFPRALIVLGLAVVFVVIFGKVFCSWLCPVAPVRSLLDFIARKRARAGAKRAGAFSDTQKMQTKALDAVDEPSASADGALAPKSRLACSDYSDCSACATKRAKLDSRHLILGGTLLSAAIFGFPVFCLICPIGLTFGTIILFWQWFNFDNISLSLLIYPAILLIELLILRKWCARFCPLGALLSLMSLPNRFFRPRVNTSKCLREQGKDCSVCCEICPEKLDPHYRDAINECSKCGLCAEKCPAKAITIPPLS
jgi:ferredoxin-type protein NapH